MTSRERINQALNHQQSDKIAIDFGSNAVTGIHVLIVEKLRQHYGLEYKPVRVIESYQMLGEVDEELKQCMGVDVEGTLGRDSLFGFYNDAPFKTFKTYWGQEVTVPTGFNTSEDDKGLMIYPQGDRSVPASGRMPKDSYFFDAIVRQEPVDDANLNVEDNLEEFGLVSEADLQHWEKVSSEARATGRAVMASLGGTGLGDIALVPGMQLKAPKGIRDVTEWYMSTIMRTDYVKNIFDRQIDIAIENFKRYNEVAGDNIDAVFICGTDFGTQNSTFCAPEQFDDLWMPYYKRINNWIHENTNWKTFKHSCGAVYSFMPKFIEAGFDIINPVQINADGMDPKLLKKNYGKDLTFWGGGVDTQKTLPYKTPQEVREEVLMLCDIFGQDGGFVFNAVHNIQANTPIENVVAMIDAVKEFNGEG